eukprot:1583451-Ditylum_brightwellii.AAC.1
MRATTGNSKAQHLTPETGATTTNNNTNKTQQSTMQGNPWGGTLPFLTHNLCAGKQQAFWQLPCTPKTAAIASCHFYS